jgi:hypothetical protein
VSWGGNKQYSHNSRGTHRYSGSAYKSASRAGAIVVPYPAPATAQE